MMDSNFLPEWWDDIYSRAGKNIDWICNSYGADVTNTEFPINFANRRIPNEEYCSKLSKLTVT